MPDMPPIRYAKSGDVYIAYRQVGEGEDVILTPGATTTMGTYWAQDWVQQLFKSARVMWYDKRGTGASDRDAHFTFEERMDDIRAVMDAEGIESAHLFGASEGGPMSLLFAATYPERVRSLTLYGTFPAMMRKADYPDGMNMTLQEYGRWVDRIVAASVGEPDAEKWFWEMFSPSLATNEAFMSAISASRGNNASPGATRAIWENLYEVDVRHILRAIRVPTTVVHYTGDRVSPIGGGRYVASHIPGAKLVELPGNDHFHLGPFPELTQAVLDNVEAAGERTSTSVNRKLSTVLFTDIVDSTPSASRAGDLAWAQLLDRHDAVARDVIALHEGTLVKTTGDGLLATFDGPSRAVRCAVALHAAHAELGLPIRAGLHAGEIEMRGDDIAGMAVHIAARVSSLAGEGETLVSSTVRDLVTGSGFVFSDRGEHALKGVEQAWRLYALDSL